MIQDIIVKLVLLLYVNHHVSRNIICKCYFIRIYFMKYKRENILSLFTNLGFRIRLGLTGLKLGVILEKLNVIWEKLGVIRKKLEVICIV